MKLATWNINSLTVRLPQVLDWLAANPVDVLCLQELKLSDDKFPREALQQAGYHSAVFGQKTYNGVAILSRTPVRDVVTNIPGFADDAVARDRRHAGHAARSAAHRSTATSSTARSLAARNSPTRCAGCRRCTTGCVRSWPRIPTRPARRLQRRGR
jgi:exonuclease III